MNSAEAKKQERIAIALKEGKPMKKENGKKKTQSRVEATKQDGGIPFDELKEGSLKRMLKVKKDDKKLGKGEMNRLSKVPDGERFEFRGNDLKMTPLMKKRVNLAKSMLGFKK